MVGEAGGSWVGEVGRGGEKTGETSATSCDEYGGSSSGSVGVVDASLAAARLSLWSEATRRRRLGEEESLAPDSHPDSAILLQAVWL